VHLPLLLPLAAALLYAMAALCLKIALGRGLTTWSVLFFSNMVMGLFFLPLLLGGTSSWNHAVVPWALPVGTLFFLGQIGTFRSVQSGCVSIETPAFAAKVVVVALFSLCITGSRSDQDL